MIYSWERLIFEKNMHMSWTFAEGHNAEYWKKKSNILNRFSEEIEDLLRALFHFPIAIF